VRLKGDAGRQIDGLSAAFTRERITQALALRKPLSPEAAGTTVN
jgi:hypothetical protein